MSFFKSGLSDKSIELDASRLRVLLSSLALPPAAVSAIQNVILRVPSDSTNVQTYPKTATGLSNALSDASSRDMIWIPPCTLTGDFTVPAGVGLLARGEKTIIGGTITLGAGAYMHLITVQHSESSSSAVVGVVCGSSGTNILNNCHVEITNSGTGDAYGVQGSDGAVLLWGCWLEASATGGGSGYGAIKGAGTVTIIGGSASGSTSRFGGGAGASQIVYSAYASSKTKNLWNGSSNDSPPANWETVGYDDSGWTTPSVEADEFGGFDISGAERVWSDQTPTAAGEHCLIRQEFTVSGTVSSATLNLKSDDKCDIYLNGTLVASDDTFGSGNLVTESIAPELFIDGTNVLAIHGKNEALAYAWVGWSLAISAPSIEVYAIEGTPDTDVELPLWGDRAVFDALGYSGRHTNDTDASSDSIHHTLGTGSDQAAPGNHTHAATEYPGHLTISQNNVSNPPTEAQLITAFGSPDEFADASKVGVINDNAGNGNVYAVLSDGGHYYLLPLAQATLASVSVSVASTNTLASSTGRWYGRASLKVLATGVAVLVYREGSAHASNDDEIHIRFSDDYGATWSNEDEDLEGNSVDVGYPTGADVGDSYGVGEPWLYLADNGDLILHTWKRLISGSSTTTAGTWQTISTDGGLTWSSWSQVDFTGTSDDNNWFATDDDFVYNGTIYAAARVYPDSTGTPQYTVLIKSDDDGITWDYVSDISSTTENTIEVGLEYLGNSTILAILRGIQGGPTYKTISTDMGSTWGTLEEIDDDIGIVGRPRIYTRAHLKGLDNWWNDQVLIMVGFETQVPGSWLNRRNAVWVSQDAGNSWSGPFYLDTEVDDSGYGDLIFDPVNEVYRVILNQGDTSESDLIQYNLTTEGF